MSKIFISHSSKDKELACDLAARLDAQGYNDIFLDVDPDGGIRTGENWEQVLYDNLKLSRALIVLCSTHSMISHWCFAEITHARVLGKNIFPIQLESCEVFSLLQSHYQILDLDRFQNKDSAYAVLWRDMEKAGLKEDLPFDSKQPYPGLDAFKASDAGVFFGREPEIEEVQFRLEEMHRWREPRLAVILGASGSGKSSLVRAGVLPRLQCDATRWIVLPPFRPGDHPITELAKTLSSGFPGGRNWKELRKDLNRAVTLLSSDTFPNKAIAPTFLNDLAVDLKQAYEEQKKSEMANNNYSEDSMVLMVIDQFEELFKLEDDKEAHDFLRLISASLRGKGPPLMVLATLRSDFFGAFQTHSELQEVSFREWSLKPMPYERLEEVILKPAAKVGVEFEKGLVGHMIADTKTENALPLLAFTLRELYEKYGEDKLLLIDKYKRLGGVETAVAKVAHDIVENISEIDEKILRRAFLQMVQISRGQFVRRKVAIEQISEETKFLLRPFIDRHLLVNDGETIEVAHEALFRVWDRLKDWLDINRDYLLWHQRLRVAHYTWLDTQLDEGSLLRGIALTEAEHWLAEEVTLEPNERKFIEESLASRQRALIVQELRRRRTLQATIGIAFVFLVLAVISIWQWQRAENQLNRSTAQRLGVMSQAALGETYDNLIDAVLLATESLKLEMTAEGFTAWAKGMSLLPRNPIHTFVAGKEVGTVGSVAFSPNGEILAIAAGKIFLLDTRTHTVLDTLYAPRNHGFHSVAFSPDGRFLAGSHDGTEVWEWNEGQWQLRQSLPYLGALDFSPDSKMLTIFSTGSDPKLMVMETTNWSGKSLETDYPKESLAFSPDGKWLAMGGIGTDGVGLWDVTTGRLVANDQSPGTTVAVEFLSSSRLMTANSSGMMHFFLLTGAGNSIQLEEKATRRLGTSGEIALTVNEKDRLILTGSISEYPQGVGRLWYMASGWNLYEVGRLGHDARVEVVAFNPVSGEPVTTSGSTVYVWPADPATASFESLQIRPYVQNISFSPDGQWLVAGRGDSVATIIKTNTWQKAENLNFGEEIKKILFNSNSQLLILAGSTIVRIYETSSWKEHKKLEGPYPVTDAFISPNGEYLILLGDSLIQPYEISSWKKQPNIGWRDLEIRENEAQQMKEIYISPDELRLATLIQNSSTINQGRRSEKTEIVQVWKTWDIQTGRNIDSTDSLIGQWQKVWPDSSAQISPDNLWSFTNSGSDIFLKDVLTGAQVAQWRHTDLKDYKFSPEGRWLVTAGGDGWIRIWPLQAEDMIRMAGERLPHNLSEEKFKSYFPGMSYKPTFNELPIPNR